MESNNSDMTKTHDFAEHVRKRPAMYIGNNGSIGLFHGVILECIELCKSDKITFELIISADNDFSIRLNLQHDLSNLIDKLNTANKSGRHYFLDVLKVLSKDFDVNSSDKNNLVINFALDKGIIAGEIDYLKLAQEILRIALLNRQCEIITIDKRQKYLTQNYFHFPEGLFYLFDRATKEVLGKPEFKMTFDDKVNSNRYQIGLAYRTDWYPPPNVISFANDVPTINGGSLVDGIMSGFINACKIYVRENKLVNHKVTKKKL